MKIMQQKLALSTAAASLALAVSPVFAQTNHHGGSEHLPPADDAKYVFDGSKAADQVPIVTKDGSHLPPASGGGSSASASADSGQLAGKGQLIRFSVALEAGSAYQLLALSKDGDAKLLAAGIASASAAPTSGQVPGVIVDPPFVPTLTGSKAPDDPLKTEDEGPQISDPLTPGDRPVFRGGAKASSAAGSMAPTTGQIPGKIVLPPVEYRPEVNYLLIFETQEGIGYASSK